MTKANISPITKLALQELSWNETTARLLPDSGLRDLRSVPQEALAPVTPAESRITSSAKPASRDCRTTPRSHLGARAFAADNELLVNFHRLIAIGTGDAA